MARRKKAPNDLGEKIAALRRALQVALGVENPPILEAVAFCLRFRRTDGRPASLADIVAHLRAEEEERRAASRSRSTT